MTTKTRFTSTIKLGIVRAHLDGKDVSEELERHNVSPDELDAWLRGYVAFGEHGLKTTKVQEIRRSVCP